MDLIGRARNILMQPRSEWQKIDGETTTAAELYTGYVAPLAAIGPIASAIGLSVFGISLPFLGSYRISPGSALAGAVTRYILSLIGVYVLALVIDWLAPTFQGQKNPGQALKASAYSSTAAWLAGIFGLVPALGVLGIVGLYSLYLLYLGLPVLMKSPREKALGYTVVVVIAAVVIFVVIALVGRLFVPYPAAPVRFGG